jgi:hypothetical protein
MQNETLKLSGQNSEAAERVINSKVFLLQEEVSFLKKAVQIVKDLKS